MSSNIIQIEYDASEEEEDNDEDDQNSPYHSRAFNFSNFVYTMNNDIVLDESMRQGFATVFLGIVDASASISASNQEKSSTKKRKTPNGTTNKKKKNTLLDASSSAVASSAASIPVYIDFTNKIPEFNHYKAIQTQKWKASRLKSIAKHYKLKQSGNKEELVRRIYDFLHQSFYAQQIQKLFRGHLVRHFVRSCGPALKKRNICNNPFDFYSMDPVDEIRFPRFFSYRDPDDGFIYGFDISSIYTLIFQAKRQSKHAENPFNRRKLNMKPLISSINFIIRFCLQITGESILNDLYLIGSGPGPGTQEQTRRTVADATTTQQITNISTPTPVVDQQQATYQYIADVIRTYNPRNGPFRLPPELQATNQEIIRFFHSLDDLGNYTNPNWYLELGVHQIIRFLRELKQIFNVRLGLTTAQKRLICPMFNGDPFGNIMNIVDLNDFNTVRSIGIIIMKRFTSNPEIEQKQLAAQFILMALTLVSRPAAESLDWLYQAAR